LKFLTFMFVFKISLEEGLIKLEGLVFKKPLRSTKISGVDTGEISNMKKFLSIFPYHKFVPKIDIQFEDAETKGSHFAWVVEGRGNIVM